MRVRPGNVAWVQIARIARGYNQEPTGAASRQRFALLHCCGHSLKALMTWDMRASEEDGIGVCCHAGAEQQKMTRDRCLQAVFRVASDRLRPNSLAFPSRIVGNMLNPDNRGKATDSADTGKWTSCARQGCVPETLDLEERACLGCID